MLTDDALIVGRNAEAIAYHSISSVDAMKVGSDLNIHLQTLLSMPTRTIPVMFANASDRDAALAALGRRLRFQRREVQYGVVRAALAPLVAGSLVGMFTYVSVGGAALVAAGEERYLRTQWEAALLIPVFRLLGPRGVAVIGGLVVIACMAALFARVLQSPIVVTLNRSDSLAKTADDGRGGPESALTD